ncbi:MAG: DUF1287 domain-containing protein [Proteobacteria bacterium]|nr:DUF1287 domain-containing protein [Pseudomonadota bacterium]
MELDRRTLLSGGLALAAWPVGAGAGPSDGARLARAARTQVGVTKRYDSGYRRLAYPGGDPPRAVGVCADVIVRAGRDGLGLDLQKLVHEDMARDFRAYPQAWGLKGPDPNIDHRRVLNLETYWRRAGAQLWRGQGHVAGYAFPEPLRPGDILTWVLLGRGPHVGMVVEGGGHPRIVHNIAWGAQEIPLAFMWPHRARAHFRWPAVAGA